MTRSPFAATFVVVFLMIGTPVVLVRRISDGLLPTQAYDITLALGVLAWILVSKAILDRNDVLHSLVENRLSPTWQAHSLVEQSLFGVGFTGGRKAEITTSPRLFQLSAAGQPIETLMPPPLPQQPETGRIRGEFGDAGPPRPQPTLRQQEPTAPPILATEAYTVVRGDTFWSIAEARLGDGRRWKSLEELNLGREVAPGVFFGAGDAVRIGWSVLAPLVEEAEPNK